MDARRTRCWLRRLALLAVCWPLAGAADTLLELYQRTLDTNPTLKGREFGIVRAEAQKDQAFSKLLPQIVAIGSYSLNDYHQQAGAQFGGLPSRTISAQYDGLRGTVQLKQALFDLASYYRWTGADAVILQSREELEAARLALTGDLIDRYLTALQAADEMTYVATEQSSVGGQLQRLQAMYARQMAKVTDVLEVEAYAQSLRSKAIEADNARAVAIEKLRELVGGEVRDLAPLRPADLPPVDRGIESWATAAVSHNPNLNALQHAIAAAEQLASSSRAEHAPQVSLVLSETYSDLGFDNRTQPPYDVASANLQVNLPIYEGGRVEATYREAGARTEITRQQYEQKRREVEREARTAYLNAMTGYARIQAAAQEASAQQRATEAQQKGFELGVSTVIDLLDTRRRWLKAQTEQAKARYDYIRGLVGLRVWAGELDAAEIEAMDRWLVKINDRRETTAPVLVPP